MRVVPTLATVCLGAIVSWIFYGPLVLGRIVEGRVLANGVPVAGAHFHVMPGGWQQGTTKADGKFAVEVPIFCADDIEICVEGGEGFRSTKFGEIHAGPWWNRPRGLDIELGTPRAAGGGR